MLFAARRIRSRPSARPISFIACPQFRETARTCWLAEYEGKTYYIGAFGTGTAPQLLHKVLVEGVAHDGQSDCGAITIDPIHISPLTELSYECDTVLPDNETRPREVSVFDLPVEVQASIGASLAPPPAPTLKKDEKFDVGFDFDRANLDLESREGRVAGWRDPGRIRGSRFYYRSSGSIPSH